VNYHTFGAFNTTYIVINETVSVSITSERNVIQRNFHNFDVYGSLTQNSTNLYGLQYGIFLWNGTSDVSGYLNLNGPQIRTIFDGDYNYYDITISLNCPQGQYELLIYVTGSIYESGISLTNFMVPSMSLLVPINITAGVSISGNYDTEVVKDDFYEGDTLYVYGYLNWDNGTSMASRQVEVTVKNSLGQVLATATGFTNGIGFYNISLPVGSWPSDAEVWVSFYPEDNFSYPDYYFVEFNEIEVYRET
jgi:hypothetical protein